MELCEWLDKLQSTERSERESAEHILKETNSTETVFGLLQIVKEHPSPNKRLAASVVCSALLIGQSIYHTLEDDERNTIKRLCLDALKTENVVIVSRSLSHLVGQLCSLEDDVNDWNGLHGALLLLLRSPSETFLLAGLEVFKYAPEMFVNELAKENMEVLKSVLSDSFHFPSIKVWISTVELCGTIAPYLVGFERHVLRDFIPILESSLQSLLSHPQNRQLYLTEFIQALNVLFQESSRSIIQSGDVLLRILLNICDRQDLANPSRVAAIEALLSLAEFSPHALQNKSFSSGNFGPANSELFPGVLSQVLYRILINVPPHSCMDSEDWQIYEKNLTTSESSSTLYSVLDQDGLVECAAFAISRLTNPFCFGPSIMLPVISTLSNECIQQLDWRARFAGVESLVQALESSASATSLSQLAQVELYTLSEFLQTVTQIFQHFARADSHPLIRMVSLKGIGLVCSYLNSFLTPDQFGGLCKVLVEGLSDSSNLVRLRTCESCGDLFANCSEQVDGIVLVQIVRALESLLSGQTSTGLQVAAVDALVVLARSTVALNAFQSTHESLNVTLARAVPHTLISGSLSENPLTWKYIECLACILKCIGTERSKADSLHLVQECLFNIPIVSPLPGETRWNEFRLHPCAPSICRAIEACAESLGVAIQPFLGPFVKQMCQVSLVEVLYQADCTPVHSEQLEDKAIALSSLCHLLQHVTNILSPYIHALFDILKGALLNERDDNLRILAAVALPDLVKCAKFATSDQRAIDKLVRASLEVIVPQIPKEESLEVVEGLVLGTKGLLSEYGGFIRQGTMEEEFGSLSSPELQTILVVLWERFRRSFQSREVLRAQLVLSCGEEEPDEDARMALEAGDAGEKNIRFQIAECMQEVAQDYPKLFPSLFINNFLDNALDLAHPGREFEDRGLALFILDGFLQHSLTSQHANIALNVVLPVLRENLTQSVEDWNNDILQGSAFGIGLIVRECSSNLDGTDLLDSLIAELVKAYQGISSHPENDGSCAAGTDNLLVALGKAVCFCPRLHRSCSSFNEVVHLWLSGFPFSNDPTELANSTEDLCFVLSNRYQEFSAHSSLIGRALGLSILELQEDVDRPVRDECIHQMRKNRDSLLEAICVTLDDYRATRLRSIVIGN